MINVLVHGALGRMGSIVVNRVQEAEDMTLAAGVDGYSQGGAVYKSLGGVTEKADVVIDFSHHSQTAGLLDWCVKNRVPAVICTTGHDDGEKAAIAAAGEKIPVFFSANMSMGIALLARLARRAAEVFPDADVEIVEAHHNRKADAPSGTALMLADAVKEVRPGAVLNLGRSGMGKREKNEIGVQAVRMGNLPGTHVVLISTDSQTIELKHEAHDRSLFADGALAAARFLVTRGPGVYDMGDMVK